MITLVTLLPSVATPWPSGLMGMKLSAPVGLLGLTVVAMDMVVLREPFISSPRVALPGPLEDEISNTDSTDNTGFTGTILSRGDYFGYSVSLDSNTLAVGAYGDDASGCGNCGGCLYLHLKVAVLGF